MKSSSYLLLLASLGALSSCYQETPKVYTWREKVEKSKVSLDEMAGKSLAEITAEARRRKKIYSGPTTWQTNPEMYFIHHPTWTYRLTQGDSVTKEGITVTVYGASVEIKKDGGEEFWNCTLSEHGEGRSGDGISVSYFTDWTLFEKSGTSEPISDANRAEWPTNY